MLAQRAGDARAGADESHDDLVSGRTNRPTTRPGSGPNEYAGIGIEPVELGQ